MRQKQDVRFMENPLSYLEVARRVLESHNRPMTSQEIVQRALQNRLLVVRGATPHKTMNARLSEDILRNPDSPFMRSDHGQFALKNWSGSIAEFEVKRRRINPIEENILAIRRPAFLELIDRYRTSSNSPFVDVPPQDLLSNSISRKRMEIEEDNSFVQLVSLFHVVFNGKVLTYNRTSRLPEARLHHIKSINFGGHMQDIDRAPMFEQFLTDEMYVVFSRELFEELEFGSRPRSISYIGSIYSTADEFSQRHIGVAFEVQAQSAQIRSAEPGFHTSVEFMDVEAILQRSEAFDDWTQLVLARMGK